MNRRSTNLVLMVFLVLAIALAGCRRSAAPPLELTPEDEDEAAMQEAEENTATMEAEEATEPTDAEETTEATEEPEATEEEPEDTPMPTPDPTATPTPTEEVTAGEETVTSESEQTTTAAGIHVVQPGENMFRIALRYGTTVGAIAKANNITNPSLIYVGQRLKIPSGTTPPSPAPSPGVKTYVVKPGDNLFRIALRHNYNTYYLARYNGIENPSTIYVGQVIRIP